MVASPRLGRAVALGEPKTPARFHLESKSYNPTFPALPVDRSLLPNAPVYVAAARSLRSFDGYKPVEIGESAFHSKSRTEMMKRHLRIALWEGCGGVEGGDRVRSGRFGTQLALPFFVNESRLVANLRTSRETLTLITNTFPRRTGNAPGTAPPPAPVT